MIYTDATFEDTRMQMRPDDKEGVELRIVDGPTGEEKVMSVTQKQAAAILALAWVGDELNDYGSSTGTPQTLGELLYQVVGDVFDEVEQKFRPIP